MRRMRAFSAQHWMTLRLCWLSVLTQVHIGSRFAAQFSLATDTIKYIFEAAYGWSNFDYKEQALYTKGVNYDEAVRHCPIPSLTRIATVSKSHPPEEEPSHNTKHSIKSWPLKNPPISVYLGKYEAPITTLAPQRLDCCPPQHVL